MPPDPTHPAPRGPAQRDWFVTTIPTSLGTEGFDVSPDWKELWTAAAGDGKLWIIDTAQRKVAASIDAKLNGANRLKFTPDGKRVLISILSTGDLFVYDVASRKEITRVSLGKGCAGILMDPDGSRAFADRTVLHGRSDHDESLKATFASSARGCEPQPVDPQPSLRSLSVRSR
jgi:DNA-binding beta-propeller fold protein YncE